LSPGPVERLKPYFKPRPRQRAVSAAAPQPAQSAPAKGAQPPPADPATQPTQPAPATPSPPPPQPSSGSPPPAAPSPDGAGLRSRRDQLARRFAELQSDLGGLVYEMAIRDSFRHEVLIRRAAELQSVDRELTAVEQQLGIVPAVANCPSCGAPLQPGSLYCGRCGKAVGAPAPGGTR
jgi:hypothetical protein